MPQNKEKNDQAQADLAQSNLAFDLEKLIKTWADAEAKKHNVSCEWIDLRHARKATIKIKEKISSAPQPCAANSRVVKRSEAIKQGEGTRRDDLSERKIAGGAAKTTITEAINTTATTENSLSFTQQLSGGFSLGVSYFVNLGVQFDISHSKTKTARTAVEESITSSQQFELEAGKRYQITKDVFEVPYLEEIQLAITLSGTVAVHLNKVSQFTHSKTEKNKLHFIPVATIIDELKKRNALSKGVVCDVTKDQAVFTLQVQHAFNKYTAEIISTEIDKDLHEKAISTEESSVEKQTGNPQKTLDIKDQANVKFNFANVMSSVNMTREGFQKMHKETPELAQNDPRSCHVNSCQ